MKRYLIIGLILLIGATFIIVPLLKNNTPDLTDPAEFNFKENLQVQYGKDLPVAFTINRDDITKLEVIYADEVVETYNNPKIGKQSLVLDADFYGVGTRPLVLRVKLSDGTSEESDSRMIRVISDIPPKPLTAVSVNPLPHNTANYTQGLEFNNGLLYEGTGNPGNTGESSIGVIDMATGQYVTGKKNGLDATYFGEGITIVGDDLFQLTWRNGKCFIYDKNTLKLKREFTYSGEGWGLCNDGKYLIMSDGSERITFRDPKTFAPVKTIEVYDDNGPRTNINELEYIDGKIYANIYTTNTIITIEPTTGRVLENIDASPLEAVGKMGGEVLNGIAYNPATKKLYMTGKNWGKIMEVEIKE